MSGGKGGRVESGTLKKILRVRRIFFKVFLCSFSLKGDIQKRLLDLFFELPLYLLHKDQILDNIPLRIFFLFSCTKSEETVDMWCEKVYAPIDSYGS